MIKRLVISSFLSFLALFTVANSTQIDSLINLTHQERNDSVLLDLYNEIGSATYKVDQQLAKKYWTKAQQLAENKIKGNRTHYFVKQLSIAKNGLGIVNRRMGNYSEALTYYFDCLKLNEEIKNDTNISSTLQNIGIIYRDLEEYDKAIDYYDKSLEMRLQINDSLALAGSYNAYGILYRRIKEYQKALDYYHKSLAISEKLNDNENVAQSHNNIGVVYVLKKDYPKAVEYFQKAFDLHSSKNNEAGIARYYANMTHVYDRQGNVSKSIEFGLKAYQQYQEMGRKNDLSQVAHKLSKLYVKTNNYKNSLQYYKEYIALRDSVFNKKTTRDIAQKELQFEYDKKMLADSLARVEAEKIKELEHQQELNQQKTYSYGGAIILLIVIVFSIMLYKRLKISNKQKAIIEEQKLIVEVKNKEIVDSINYAKRIQSAILPSIEKIRKYLPDTFVLYQPKDIVAGDFYWFAEKEGKILIAVADCTGHGVPGAMVSVVCHNALNRAVNDFKLVEPSKILDRTAELVKEAFKKNNEEVKDGMDISLCAFDLKNNELEYAGAINSLFYVTENKLKEVKGDKQPIGQFADVKPFTNHKIALSQGDRVYMFSDGYADQFGGEKGKKYMYRRFRDLISSISKKEFSTQKQELMNEFENWRGGLEQLDDVCVIGVRV